MKAGIETIEDVFTTYGPLVGEYTARFLALGADPALGDIVDIITGTVEDTLTTLGFEFERKEGF